MIYVMYLSLPIFYILLDKWLVIENLVEFVQVSHSIPYIATSPITELVKFKSNMLIPFLLIRKLLFEVLN